MSEILTASNKRHIVQCTALHSQTDLLLVTLIFYIYNMNLIIDYEMSL